VLAAERQSVELDLRQHNRTDEIVSEHRQLCNYAALCSGSTHFDRDAVISLKSSICIGQPPRLSGNPIARTDGVPSTSRMSVNSARRSVDSTTNGSTLARTVMVISPGEQWLPSDCA
jgi:hypothetical protein